MVDMDRTFNAFRICITDRKCENTDCPYEYECEKVNSGYIQIPKVLALDVMQVMKEQQPKTGRWVDEEDNCSSSFPVPQDAIATIMNRINEGLDGTGYIAEGYENTDAFLYVLVNKE